MVLRTALKPVWILALLFALAVSAVFVGLSKWQFEAAESNAPPPLTQTETPVPLTSHFEPGASMLGTEADQVVTFTGRFLPEHEVFVAPRVNEGRDGHWVVTAAAVDGAPDGQVIPVVRGWTQDPEINDPAPSGPVEVTGRLLPADGPEAGTTEHVDGRTVVSTVATAELVNLWDVPSYAGYVAAFNVVPAGESSTLASLEAGQSAGETASARDARDIGAKSEGADLEPVWVSPQPQQTQVVWMNVFYAVEWIVFAAFALYLWWRFVRDDHLREEREKELDRQWAKQWRAEELERRREQARRAKEQATDEFKRYHRDRERLAVGAARRDHLAGSRTGADRPTLSDPQEDQ